METAAELLKPLHSAANAYRANTVQSFNQRIIELRREADELAEDLDALYRFDPVKAILNNEPRSLLSECTQAISQKEALTEALNTAIEQLRINQNSATKPLTPIMGRISMLTASCLLGKTAILASEVKDPNKTMPAEVNTWKANYAALKAQFKQLNAINDFSHLTAPVIAQINLVTSHQTMEGIAA